MITNGFTCETSDLVTVGTAFSDPNSSISVISSYISIPTTGTEGGIVYVNRAGQTCYWPYAFIGYNPISAVKILASATINSVLRTTTATPMYWHAAFQ